MASGQVLEKLRNYYSKAEGEVKKWDIAQVSSRMPLIFGVRGARLTDAAFFPLRNGWCRCWAQSPIS